MRLVRTVDELRTALAPARHSPGAVASAIAPHTIALVPTMGALHEGHLSLIRQARSQCDTVVVTLFVNPSQFDESSDLDSYPRCEAADAKLVEQANVDMLFVPSIEEIYPDGFATAVEVYGLTDRLEGASRSASHFRGVTTVVTKLINIVSPDLVYLGQKDAQQVAVIKRMVADLNLPVAIEVCGTERERDGLAMSSRNAHLNPEQRARAPALYEALEHASDLAYAGERSAKRLVGAAHETMLARKVEPEYVELVDPQTFEPCEALDAAAVMVVAARIGDTRLIDNLLLDPTLAGAASIIETPTHLAT